MLLIPAIDIKDGQCVRLRQGRMDDVTVYSDDPVAVANQWVAAGARRLHVVDLDGAASGRPVNQRVVADIVAAQPDVPVQVGGGIRDEDAVQSYLEAGVEFVTVGTRAVNTPHFVNDLCLEFPEHIVVALDAKDGKVAIDGWSKLSNHDALDMAQRLEADGVAAIVYTDISKDGMMDSFNLDATVELAQHVQIPVIASGGITTLDDIRALIEADEDGIIGCILGRALYEGSIDLEQAQALVDEIAPARPSGTAQPE